MIRRNFFKLLFCQMPEIDWACSMMYICCFLFGLVFTVVKNLKFSLEHAHLVAFDISSWLSEYSAWYAKYVIKKYFFS